MGSTLVCKCQLGWANHSNEDSVSEQQHKDVWTAFTGDECRKLSDNKLEQTERFYNNRKQRHAIADLITYDESIVALKRDDVHCIPICFLV